MIFVCRIQKLLSLVPSTLNWTLKDRAPLDKWVHEDGTVVLLGDACHPMLVRIRYPNRL
jgi:salicylate hydroxylase